MYQWPTYKVTGDHPILKRPDKSGLSYDEANDLVDELRDLGYENIKRTEELKLRGMCYVLVQTDKIHPITYDRFQFVWYPEREMTLLETVQYRPFEKSVVTENPWIIACYPRDNVRVWKEGRWVMPESETYGASVNKITMSLLGIRQTIPSTALDGGKQIQELKTKLESEV